MLPMKIELFNIKDKKKQKRAMIFYGYIAVFVLVCVIVYGIPTLSNKLSTTETIKYGTLQVGEEATGFIVRNDVVYVSPKNTGIKRLKKTGEKLRNNSKVVSFVKGSPSASDKSSRYLDLIKRLEGMTKEATETGADRCGVLSYTVDGYESYFTPSKINVMEYETAKEKEDSVIDISGSYSFAGDPIYKISDDKAWYFVFWTETEQMSKYETGKKVKMYFDGSDNGVDAVVYSMEETSDGWRIALKSRDYYAGFAESRSRDAKIVVSDNSGLIVSNKSITVKNGDAGVMVKDKTGSYSFVRVNVETTDGEHSVLTSTLFYDEKGIPVDTIQPYEEIKRNPGVQD